MSESSEAPEIKTFFVKLYHPNEEGVYCKNNGESVYIAINAMDKSDLRTKIESTKNGFFNGDTCESCGTLAKVSF